MKLETMVCDLCDKKWFRGDLHICPRCGLQFCIVCRSQREDDTSPVQPLKCLECGYAISPTDYLTEDEYRKLRENRAATRKKTSRRKWCGETD